MTNGGRLLAAPTARTSHIANIDALRLVALGSIVLGHVYVDSELSDRLVQSWRLPVFFVLSGYFWSSTRSLREESAIRAKRLIIPYASWLVIISGLTLPVQAFKDPESLQHALVGAILGGSYATRPLTTFWFFTALFVATVIYRFLGGLPSWVRLSIVGLGLIVNVTLGSELAQVPYALGSALGALVFLETGRAVHSFGRRIDGRKAAAAAAALLAVSGILLAVVPEFTPIDMKSGQFPLLGTVVAVLLSSGLVLTAVSLPQPKPTAARTLAWLTRPTLAVIIMHPLVLWVLRPESGNLPLPVVAAAAFIIPLAAGLILAQTNLSYPLLGVPRLNDSVKRRVAA